MGMDRNTIIGFVLIGGLLMAMFYFNSKSQLAYEGEQKRIADSIDQVKKKAEAIVAKTTVAAKPDSASPSFLNFGFASTSQEDSIVTLENNKIKIAFHNRGGQPGKVILKDFKTYDGKSVEMNSGRFNKLTYRINTPLNRSAEVSDILFTHQPVQKKEDGSQSIIFETSDSTGKKISHKYTLTADDYMLQMQISFDDADQLLSTQDLNLLWQNEAPYIERDHKYELTQTHIGFLEKGDFDFEYVGEGDQKKLTNTKWLGNKQQFFLSTLISQNEFKEANASWYLPKDSNDHYLIRTNHSFVCPLVRQGNHADVPLSMYFGPSDYNELKKHNVGLEYFVPYGNGIFAFVKYINRYFLLPVFDFIQHNVMNMGIVILLITLLIRLITSPILYKSYLSGAKMKVLKPEVDALKEKYKDDQQAFGMEQMKLWKSAGVSPLGGCLPALLQIPIFMSLYYFFQSNIDLRGKSFLWANDLAQYDNIASIPFSIPFYGDHVSLFTITAVITSLLISIYSMSNMQDNSNPLMKYMPYIFPVLLLGVFNSLPAALTWYYTVSNTITLILQIIIQKYIIDHDKIMAQIAENRKKPVKKSKMQERIEAMQESQKKLQDLKNKNSNKG